TQFRDTICTAGASSCDTTKIIRFDTAEELYRFSVDVSFSQIYITGNPTEDVKLSDAKIDELLDQHYVLGRDIDYSVMKSKTFIPIGYIFADANPVSQSFYERYFTGIFDGQGFEIKNLYLSGHNYLIYEDKSNPETIDIAMTEYYGMFNYNAGVIKNIGFIDMYTELLEMHPDLTKLTNVVGFNMPDPKTWTGSNFTKFGSVENIYVIDNRTSVTEAGIRYLVGTSSEDFEAAGIVHTNAGNFENSYFVSKVVVNANFINKFTIEPVLFSNSGNVIVNLGEPTQQIVNVTGSSSNLVYDETVYLEGDVDINNDSITDFTVKIPDPLLSTGESTADLKSGNFTYNANSWYFYPVDGYPILKGLDYIGGVYQIGDAYDLAFFSKLLNKNSVLNGTDFAHSDYVLTADIDMSILAPGSYQVPTKIFYGTFSGANGDPAVLTDNFYIYGLTINGGYSVNNEHYIGLFSRLGAGAEIKDIIFSESAINLMNTNSIYSQTFYMGAIAGKMTGATIENVLLDVDLSLGNGALSKTYLGSVVGSGSGIINRVSNHANIDFDSHIFTSGQAVIPEYYIGGIIGATSLDATLSIYDAANSGNIYGFETSSDIILSAGVSEIDVFIGGIVGKINNTEAAIHNLVAVTNKGDLYPGSVKERVGVPAYQYVGGVFGMLEGKAPILESGSSYRFANLYNEGDVYAVYQDNTAEIKSAGIGISNTNEDTEYALLFNHGTFDYDIQNLNYTDYPYSSDLFISEYGEGSGTYDKWIEIFNGTNQTVNLSGYSLRINTGSSTSWSSFNLNGTLAPGETHVVAHSSAPTSIRDFANQTTNTVMNFSGDDAIGLFKDGDLLDLFGIYANDPGIGWTVNGTSNATSNHTLIRSKNSTEPTINWVSSDWEVHDNLTLSYIKNHRPNYSFDYENFIFTASILDISNDVNLDKLTLTRVYNFASFDYESNIYSNISPFFYSINNNDTLIRFSENNGNINFSINSGSSLLTAESTLNVSAVTNNTNVDFVNFHNNADITVLNIDLKYHELFVSGFTKYLSQNKIVENSINTGDIIVAEISGSGNVYISGIVNINLSGDLHEEYQSQTQPMATEGIINTVNYGDISTHKDTNLTGILGKSNTFVGGLSTLNIGSIQDSANLGFISAENMYSSGSFRYETSSNLAGLAIYYESGIVAGGVSALAINGTSRIYDSSNNGDVIAKAYYLVRTGGVLGVSLFREAISGGITFEDGLDNSIQYSILSNGLNFGNISSITNNIAEYDTYFSSTSFTLWIGSYPTTSGSFSYSIGSSYGTEDRPAVYASAGGVIGYGLSYMRNMLNHGIISSTDVAGGVVGATYVLGDGTTIVNITTAVNYGTIKSIDYLDFSSITTLTSTNLASYYMPDGNSFIFPSGFTRETPGEKRGFGGIFGRLQRGLNGYMTSEGGAFDFIVNADPNIDLIGRLDQVLNFSSSLRFFRFPGAIYYSAKLDDTTQVVFSGFEYASNYQDNNAYQRIITITYQGYTQSGSNFNHEYLIETEIYNPYWQFGASSNANQAITVENSFTEIVTTSTSSEPGSIYTVGQYIIYNSGYRYLGARQIPWITEDPNDVNLTEDWTDPSLTPAEREYMYGPDFPMRVEEDLTKFIYYAEYDLLADRFRSILDGGTGTNVRENGMYVLSTTAGQEFGAVLPRNISTSEIELINEDLNLSITQLDYDNLAPTQTNNLPQAIIDKYENLYQTRYNDKAELTESPLQNLTLNENGGSNTVLTLPDIDYDNKEITFTISMEAFNPTLTTASFNIYDALASSNSLLAVRPSDFTMDDLIITEYIEGSSNSKAIEIYNGTGASIDLSSYSIEVYYDGSQSPGTTINLSGTLANNEVFVLANSSANATILAVTDLTSSSYSPNGNDAIVLKSGSNIIDSIGEVGDNTLFAEDVTLTRKLMLRDTNSQDGYSVEYYWDTDDIDTFTFIGDFTFDLASLSRLLYNERYDEISTAYPALLDITLPSQNILSNTTPQSLGYFSVYSEAFINDPIFAETLYYNDYEVFIVFTPNITNTGGTTGIQYVAFNGGGNITLNTSTEYTNPQPSTLDIITRGDVNYNGTLKLIFNDGKGILNEGYDFINNFKLYYIDGVDEVEVDSDHYSVSSVAVTSGGIYEIIFDFNDALLKTGNYRIKYSYFSASSLYTVDFDKAASNQAIIEDLNYYSYNDTFSPSGISFTTYINMGKVPSIDASTSNFTTQTINPSNPLYKEYLSNTYFDISFMYANSFSISPFATVTRAQLIDTTYSGGYKTYIIQYDITAENGSTSQTFTHTIIERTVALTAAFKDGNDVPLENITTTREASSTRFEIDLGFDTSNDMSGPVNYSVELTNPEHIEISVVGIELKEDELDPDVPITNIVGLTYSSNNYLIIDMSSETLPGTYTFTITYNRGLTVGTITFAALEITKFEGTNAYLSDIKFTPIASESKYPTMEITNQFNADVTQIYNPSVYFFGIDYDQADEFEYEYFRIYGQVNNIPLESYYPYMLEYLPLGATISRYDPSRTDWAGNDYYSPEVDNYSTEEQKGVLAADFTEVVGDDNIFIRYRVTSEDGGSQVYYNIKVNDITYNVTLIFDIYYCDDQDVCVLAKSTSEFTEVVQINVYNLYVHSKDSTFADPNPDENNPMYYPTFSRVSGEYNSMTQFVYTDDSDYNYRFGRNRAGFYIFEVVLPYDQYLNDMYTYEIEFTTFTLEDVDDLTFTSSKDYNGKYYYITYSEANRTRRFDIKISRADVTGDKPFGLFD
ncbi:MAG: lamin tail domain-containing protein, partial [Candidatus Izemoplasmatales bacterium]|nr:lamin tail domain-containing protein [Candidatus Izemoplasmatales bacterium]